jgi:hypothetical protein
MCTQCVFNVLRRMDDFVEQQDSREGPPSLLTAGAITQAWASELRQSLNGQMLFDEKRLAVPMMKA